MERWRTQRTSRTPGNTRFLDRQQIGLGGMNRREQEELLLFAGTRKQQKAIRQRRKAAIARMSQRQREEYLLIHGSRDEQKAVKERSKSSEQAQKKQSDS